MKRKRTVRPFVNLFCFLPGVILLVLNPNTELFGQKKTKVYIEDAEKLQFDKRDGKNFQKLIGNVKLRQDSTLFFCDSAYLDNSDNNLQAFGNVHINYNDSVNVFGDYLDYDGNTKVAELDRNVKLIDKTTILTTEHMVYNRREEIAYYFTGGTIVDEDNELSSIVGRYNTQDKNFYFRDSVVLINPDYTLRSDTLQYNTISEVVYIFGPTNIIGEEDSIYAEYGWYDTQNDIAALRDNAFVMHTEQSIRADSIYYNKQSQYGLAYGGVVLHDTVQDVIVMGEYAHFNEMTGKSFVTDSVRAVFIDQSDSLFLHADTIKVINDSLDRADKILAYYKMRFFRKDLQGACDSMVYLVKDSVIHLYADPVLWTEGNQLTADSISIYVSDNSVDSLALHAAAFIISEDTIATFNQIKGRTMKGYFRNNDLYRIDVNGNAETLYFVREETGEMIGINVSLASFMKIFLESNQIQNILYIENPDETLYPEGDLTDEDLLLRDFRWQGQRRPEKKEDIFK